MPYEVKLPDIGEGVAEGEIVRWLVRAGDRVREDQPLVEVMTDKASVEIPSPRSGVIAALHAEEGQVVNVGATIISIDADGEAPSAPGPGSGVSTRAGAHGAAAAAGTVTAIPPAPARVQAAPAVRQLAKQLGVALESVAGSGPGGAITAGDVTRVAGVARATPTPDDVKHTAGVARATPARDDVTRAAGVAPAAPAAGGPDSEERVPLRGLRRRIAEHMRHSIDTAAHFTFVAECDMTEISAHRAAHNARAGADGVRLTFLPYVIRAMTQSLREFPWLNASLDDAASEIVIKRSIHVGIATSTSEGLTVPVVRDADRLTLLELARAIDRLAAAARAGKLGLDELQGGTITVTSTGARGGVLATPILHHPQVAILGVHEIKRRPAVVGDQIVIRELGNLSLSLDHRVVDGAVGAEFLYDLIRRLESPSSWLTEREIA